MAAPTLAEATKALEAGSTGLGRAIQNLREVPKGEGRPTDWLARLPHDRIRGQEQVLFEWIEVSRSWLDVVHEHLTETAGKPLLKEEADALWRGTPRLRRDFRTHVFAIDSTLASVSADMQEGAEMRHVPIEAAYRHLFEELDPYRELLRILEQDSNWKSAQSPTEIRATLRQRTADAEAIREGFADYKILAEALLTQLRALIESEP